jgi:hypothetical protein
VVNGIFEAWFYFVEAGHKAQKMWTQNYGKLVSEFWQAGALAGFLWLF